MRKPIYVSGPEGRTLTLSDGCQGVAILPATRGDKYSFVLTSNGRMIKVTGSRIGGIGVERYAKQLGFVVAGVGDPHARQLQKLVAIHHAVHAVEAASMERSRSLQAALANQLVQFVPFAPDEPQTAARVRQRDIGGGIVAINLGTGFAAGVVDVTYEPESPSLRSNGMSLAEGWVLGTGDDPAAAPRLSEYGGIVEHAAYALVNSGLAAFGCRKHLATPEEEDIHPVFCRGYLDLQLDHNGRLEVGIDATDELVVRYLDANGNMTRLDGLESGASGLSLGMTIGCLWAPVILAQNERQLPRAKAA